MKSILIGLLLLSWIACSTGYTQTTDRAILQTDSVYCLPLWRARLLVADALRLRLADSLRLVTEERLEMVTEQMKVSHTSYTNLLNLSEQKYEKQKEITADMVRLADSWRDQSDYYQKKYKKQRRQKGLLTAVTVGLIGLIIAK